MNTYKEFDSNVAPQKYTYSSKQGQQSWTKESHKHLPRVRNTTCSSGMMWNKFISTSATVLQWTLLLSNFVTLNVIQRKGCCRTVQVIWVHVKFPRISSNILFSPVVDFSLRSFYPCVFLRLAVNRYPAPVKRCNNLWPGPLFCWNHCSCCLSRAQKIRCMAAQHYLTMQRAINGLCVLQEKCK